MEFSREIGIFMEEHRQEAFDLLLELAQIPAPSNHEEKRAEFCRNWLTAQGAEGVYIDDVLNEEPPSCMAESEDTFALRADITKRNPGPVFRATLAVNVYGRDGMCIPPHSPVPHFWPAPGMRNCCSRWARPVRRKSRRII